MMKSWTAKLVLSSVADDIKFSKWFWKGALELNMSVGRGLKSRFRKFLGNKLLGIKKAMKKVSVKVKAGLKKTGLKIKAGLKKTGAKIKVGVKNAKAAVKKTG